MADNRIAGYDLARALAFFGMLTINLWVLMEDYNSFPPWLVFVMDFIQGRAAATFFLFSCLYLISTWYRIGAQFPTKTGLTCRDWRGICFLTATILSFPGSPLW